MSKVWVERGRGFEPDPAEGNKDDWCAELGALSALGGAIDISRYMPPVLDQGSNGSCVAQAVMTLFFVEMAKQGMSPREMMSRMWAWWLCRKERGMQHLNRGCWIRQMFRLLKAHGYPPESYMPHRTRSYKRKPGVRVYRAATDQAEVHATKLGRAPVEYRRIMGAKGEERARELDAALGAGYPFAFGVTLPKKFGRTDDFDKKRAYRPKANAKMGGGHAMVGFAKVGNDYLVRNSWGDGWGDKGVFIMDREWMSKEGRDHWLVASCPIPSELIAA